MRKSFWKLRKIVGGLLGPLVLLVIFPVPANAYPRPGITQRVSVASDATEAGRDSLYPAITADGRYVAFDSQAFNLVPEDTNGASDAFVFDRATGTTERVSVSTDGSQSNNHSFYPSISAAGRYVTFQSLASNLVPGDNNGRYDVFVRDLATGTTERVSLASDGAEANASSFQPAAISADGRHVAFESPASNLVPGDTNRSVDVFVHDRATGTTERVSVSSDGSQALRSPETGLIDFSATTPAISADGRYVAFPSYAVNLVLGDTNGVMDVFVHDRATGATERISVASDGSQANAASSSSYTPAISADGRYVAFPSTASNLIPGDTNGVMDVFVRDRATGATERVSVASDGAQANGSSYYLAITSDGRHVAFASTASNLVLADTNGRGDVFVHDRATGTTERVSVSSQGAEANAASHYPAISADGRYVAFFGSASNLVPGDTNGKIDVFVHDRGASVGVVGTLSIQDGPGGVNVSGLATFSGAVLSSVDDPTGDGVPGGGPSSEDLTGASLTYRPEQEDLLIRWRVDSLPGGRCANDVLCEHGGGAPGAVAPGVLHGRSLYGMGFELEGTSYEVRARSGSTVRVGTETIADGPHFALYNCDSACTEQALLDGAIGTTGAEIMVSVPLSLLNGTEGMTLADIRAFVTREQTALETSEDEADLPDASISRREVSLGIAPASTPEAEVAFDTVAALTDGTFSGTIPTAGLTSGSHRVWARACLGEVCGAAFGQVTL